MTPLETLEQLDWTTLITVCSTAFAVVLVAIVQALQAHTNHLKAMAEIDQLKRNFKPNGNKSISDGGSMADSLNRIEENQAAMQSTQKTILQTQRRHGQFIGRLGRRYEKLALVAIKFHGEGAVDELSNGPDGVPDQGLDPGL